MSLSHERPEVDLTLLARQSLEHASDILINLDPSEVHTFFDSLSATSAMANLAAVACQMGDAETALNWAQRTETVPGASPHDVTKAYFGAVRAGSEQAYERLNDLLTAEREEAAAKIAAEEKPRNGYRLIGDNIESVIVQCASSGIDPSHWIENFGVNPEHQWILRMKYLNDAERNGLSPEIADSQRIELAQGLLTGNYDDRFTFAELDYAAAAVHDSDTKQQLVDHFQALCDTTPLTSETFRDLTSTAHQVIRDIGLATPERIEWYSLVISKAAEKMGDAGMDKVELAQAQLSWGLQVAQYQGRTPVELTEVIDTGIGAITSLDLPEQSDGTIETTIRNKDHFFRLRNSYLGGLAKDRAEVGDFTGASYLLSQVGGEELTNYDLRRCLDLAAAPEDVDALAPDDFAQLLNPGAMDDCRVAKILISGDLGVMRNEAVTAAADLQEHRNSELVRRVIDRAIAIDPITGIEIARELLPVAREHGAGFYDLLVLHHAIINNGGNGPQHQALLEDIAAIPDSVKRAEQFTHFAVSVLQPQ